jgi:hypothetical protein
VSFALSLIVLKNGIVQQRAKNRNKTNNEPDFRKFILQQHVKNLSNSIIKAGYDQCSNAIVESKTWFFRR